MAKARRLYVQDLKAYLRNSRFEGVRFRASKFDVSKVPAQPVDEVETELGLADLLLAIGRVDDARLAYRKLETMYPDNLAVRIALGEFASRTRITWHRAVYSKAQLTRGAGMRSCSTTTPWCCGN